MSKYDLKLEGGAFQKFMLQHAEKVVLALGIIAAAYFIWIGFKTPVFNRIAPNELAQQASRVEQHINAPTSWEQIRDYRKGIKDTEQRIDRLSGSVATSDYELGYMRGVAAKALGLRLDPELLPATDLEVRSYRAPLVISFANPEIQRLKVAGSDDTQTTGENPPEERRGARDRDVKIDAGTKVPSTQLMEMVGVRPETASVGASYNTYVKDFVVVTAVVPIQEQIEAYKAAFANAQAYYPPEDRPIYAKLEVQRRVEGEDWTTLDENNQEYRRVLEIFPDKHSPEVIEPEYYDEQLTLPVPLIAMEDYRQWVTHSKVPLRSYVPTSLLKELDGTSETKRVILDPFNQRPIPAGDQAAGRDQSPQEESDPAGEIERLAKGNISFYLEASKKIHTDAEFKMVRFVDVAPPLGKPVQYRVRLWLKDPNQRDSDAARRAAETGAGGRTGQGALNVGGGNAGGGSATDGGEAPGRGAGTGGGRGGLPGSEEPKFERIPVIEAMLHASVRKRLLEEPSSEDWWVQAARPTEWSEPSPFVTAGAANSEFFAGDLVSEGMRYLRQGDLMIPLSEPIARIVAAIWSDKFHTLVPTKQEVARGDLLNFVVERAHILNPRSYQVLEVENEPIRTQGVVVDIMGGTDLPFRIPPVTYQAPTDILVMDANGKFHIQNSLNDLRQFRHALFLEDEKAEYGKPRRTEEETNRNNR